MKSKSSLILIVGPTASGKSDLGLQLAERFHGSILNCDSLQFYQRMDIGTAKPPQADRRRVPHHLFDMVPPGEVLTAGDFRRQALQLLLQAKAPVFGVGGSGFYIQALEKGMFDVPKPRPETEAAVRQRLREQGVQALHEELCRRDPAYGARINPNDAYRITRALILMDDSGRTVSQVRAEFAPEPLPVPVLKLGVSPTREQLLPRVTRRVSQMLEAGFLAEVEGLCRDGFASWPPLQSVGYKECLQCLQGQIDRAQLPGLIVEKTMQLAKKQRTWFQRDAGIHWLNTDAPLPQAVDLVGAFLDRLGASS